MRHKKATVKSIISPNLLVKYIHVYEVRSTTFKNDVLWTHQNSGVLPSFSHFIVSIVVITVTVNSKDGN